MKFTTGYEFRNGTYSRWHAWELLVVSIILLVVCFKGIVTKPGGRMSLWMNAWINLIVASECHWILSFFENKLCMSIKV